jgi:predicted nucleotidyltransferase
VIGECDHSADSGKFVEFLLKAIYDALCEIADIEQVIEQVERLLEVIGDKECSTKELMELLGLKHRPTFRDNYLLPALELGLIEMTVPDKPNSSKQKYKKVKYIEK